MPARRIQIEDIHVPSDAEDIPNGYPALIWTTNEWDLQITIYAPILPSPRARVTSRGTFLPSDYRKHCVKLGATMAYARGVYESSQGKWNPDARMQLCLSFCSPKKPGDNDNMEKTIMDAGQLQKKEPPGAELWTNDRQIDDLRSKWKDSGDPQWWLTQIRIKMERP